MRLRQRIKTIVSIAMLGLLFFGICLYIEGMKAPMKDAPSLESPKPYYDSKLFYEDKNGFKYYKSKDQKSYVGIDVSSFQKTIDWDKLAKSGIDFYYIRLGYRGYDLGSLLLDKCFEQNIKAALDRNLKVGVYFVTQAINEDEARAEAEFVLDKISGYNISYPIAIDVESSVKTARAENLDPATRTANVKAFCKAIKEHGYEPIIYSNENWFLHKLNLDDLLEYKLWVAAYKKNPTFSKKYEIWQYTNLGRAPGIEGDIDLNIAFEFLETK